jgi:dTDP-4-amino-4,6-dideoxygalactose transaminase
MKIINYSSHYIDKDDCVSVLKVLNSDYLTKGNNLINFENLIKENCKVNYCLAMVNASCALLACLKALNITKKNIVWCSDNTYIATINCALHLGAQVDLVDINLHNYNICEDKLEKKLIEAKIKKKLPNLLIVTHLAGHPCNLKKIFYLARKYNFKIIEDASHAFGTIYENTIIGDCKYSEACIFSFHPVKIITTCEGGAVTTKSKKIYQNLKQIRENGIIFKKNKYQQIDQNYYDVSKLGYNFRLNELECALGISQIKKKNAFIKYKAKIAQYYYKNIDQTKFILPDYSGKKNIPSWHLFIIRINFKKIKKTKNQIINYLRKKNILVKTHYPPISTFSLMKKIKNKYDNKNALEYYKSAISIPIYYNLSKKIQKYIVEQINSI